MESKEMLEKVMKLSQRPTLFEKGTGNIWTEEYLSEQMLKCHLDSGSDASSRRKEMIDEAVYFIHDHIKEKSSILDLGCGPGLYAEALCRHGHKVTGVDFSKKSIDYARASAKEQGLPIEYVCEDIFKLEWQETYDVIIQVYGEINTFSTEERDALLSVIHKTLRENGLFIFDVTTPVHRHKEDSGRRWDVSDQGFWRGSQHLVLEEVFDYGENIWCEQYTVVDQQEVKVYRTWFHDYTKEEIERVCLEAGFSEVEIMENLYNTEKIEQSEWLTVIARK